MTDRVKPLDAIKMSPEARRSQDTYNQHVALPPQVVVESGSSGARDNDADDS